MKLLFLTVTAVTLSFLLWSALKETKPHGDALQQRRSQAMEESFESSGDPNLPPLRDPWDRKWHI
jgi:hypothetical protein